jgi:hypothetical protein
MQNHAIVPERITLATTSNQQIQRKKLMPNLKRRFIMSKKVGILGLMVAAAIGLFHPGIASAQDRYDDRVGYAQRDHRDHDRHDWGRRDLRGDDGWRAREWREARERQEWHEHEWRQRRDPRFYSYQSSGAYGYFGYGR